MQNATPVILLAAVLLCVTTPAAAAELKVGANDTVQSVLATQKGARVTVRIRSGQEVTGIVREVNARVVQLGAIGGKEYFDAVLPIDAIDAVFVRTKD